MNTFYSYVSNVLPDCIKLNMFKLVGFLLILKNVIYSSDMFLYIFRPFHSVKYYEKSDKYMTISTLNIVGQTHRSLLCLKHPDCYYFNESDIKISNELILVDNMSLYDKVLQKFRKKKIFNESFVSGLEMSNYPSESNVSFLTIEYIHPKLSGHLNIVLDKEHLRVGNQILSPRFVSRYLAYTYGTHVIFEDMDYSIVIIDNYLNIYTIDKDNIIYLGIDNYIVENIVDDSKTVKKDKNNNITKSKLM